MTSQGSSNSSSGRPRFVPYDSASLAESARDLIAKTERQKQQLPDSRRAVATVDSTANSRDQTAGPAAANEDDWQSKLSNWKSRRQSHHSTRSHDPDSFGEEITTGTSTTTTTAGRAEEGRKTKTFSEMTGNKKAFTLPYVDDDSTEQPHTKPSTDQDKSSVKLTTTTDKTSLTLSSSEGQTKNIEPQLASGDSKTRNSSQAVSDISTRDLDNKLPSKISSNGSSLYTNNDSSKKKYVENNGNSLNHDELILKAPETKTSISEEKFWDGSSVVSSRSSGVEVVFREKKESTSSSSRPLFTTYTSHDDKKSPESSSKHSPSDNKQIYSRLSSAPTNKSRPLSAWEMNVNRKAEEEERVKRRDVPTRSGNKIRNILSHYENQTEEDNNHSHAPRSSLEHPRVSLEQKFSRLSPEDKKPQAELEKKTYNFTVDTNLLRQRESDSEGHDSSRSSSRPSSFRVSLDPERRSVNDEMELDVQLEKMREELMRSNSIEKQHPQQQHQQLQQPTDPVMHQFSRHLVLTSASASRATSEPQPEVKVAVVPRSSVKTREDRRDVEDKNLTRVPLVSPECDQLSPSSSTPEDKSPTPDDRNDSSDVAYSKPSKSRAKVKMQLEHLYNKGGPVAPSRRAERDATDGGVLSTVGLGISRPDPLGRVMLPGMTSGSKGKPEAPSVKPKPAPAVRAKPSMSKSKAAGEVPKPTDRQTDGVESVNLPSDEDLLVPATQLLDNSAVKAKSKLSSNSVAVRRRPTLRATGTNRNMQLANGDIKEADESTTTSRPTVNSVEEPAESAKSTIDHINTKTDNEYISSGIPAKEEPDVKHDSFTLIDFTEVVENEKDLNLSLTEHDSDEKKTQKSSNSETFNQSPPGHAKEEKRPQKQDEESFVIVDSVDRKNVSKDTESLVIIDHGSRVDKSLIILDEPLVTLGDSGITHDISGITHDKSGITHDKPVIAHDESAITHSESITKPGESSVATGKSVITPEDQCQVELGKNEMMILDDDDNAGRDLVDTGHVSEGSNEGNDTASSKLGDDSDNEAADVPPDLPPPLPSCPPPELDSDDAPDGREISPHAAPTPLVESTSSKEEQLRKKYEFLGLDASKSEELTAARSGHEAPPISRLSDK